MQRNKQTSIVKIDPDRVDKDKVEKIADILGKGGIMAFPTETFYGLGAHALIRDAVESVYRIKNRDPGKPVSVIVSDLAMFERIVQPPPPVFKTIAARFWPGPLTVILRAVPGIPEDILGPDRTIGIRYPRVDWLRALVKMLGAPITATSANVSGEKELYDPRDVKRAFAGLVDLIVDGGRTPGLLATTVLDLSGDTPRIVRDGQIARTVLEEFLE
ncbi:MAG: threonylcarbamoyl-AMP synthase [Candidatus Aminicenantes bacterium]|nr:threonylcarbamoyl-AMP synthase [Candidatus Aminicenantes bacterium]